MGRLSKGWACVVPEGGLHYMPCVGSHRTSVQAVGGQRGRHSQVSQPLTLSRCLPLMQICSV